MNPNRAKQDAIPFDGGGLYEPIPGMMIVEHARIQFIAAAISGIMANPNCNDSNEDVIDAAIKAADYALKAGGYTNE